MFTRSHTRLFPIFLILLAVAIPMLHSLGAQTRSSRTASPTVNSPTAPVHRTFALRGSLALNWNDTNPGPFISVVSGDLVTILLISEDSLTHSWFLDFNGNNIVDASETATFSGFFSSTTTFFNFTWTPVIGTNVPAAGNWTYKCSVHPFNMFGTFRVLPEQVTTPISTSSTLSGSSVTTTGTLNIDMRSFQLSASLTVTATNTTTGTTSFSKTYTPSGLQMFKPMGSITYRLGFLLNAAVAPYALSVGFLVQLTGLTVSMSNLLTRELDINGDGTVTILDVAIASSSFGAKLGASNYNPKADFNADGIINIIDISVIAAQFGSKAFY